MEIFRSPLVPLAVLFLLPGTLCPVWAEPGEKAAAEQIRESDLRKELKNANVVLIVLNSLASGHLHCYGYERETSPNIDALAAEGVRFTRCYAETPTDFSSNATLLTGLDPMTTGLFGPYKVGMQLAPEFYTFAEMMADAGYNTAGFVSSLQASRSVHLEQGFFYHREFFQETTRIGPADADREIKDWLQKARNERFFAFIQIEPPDAPYLPPPPFFGKFADSRAPSIDKNDPLRRENPLPTSEVSRKVYDATKVLPLRTAYDENVAYADYRVGLYLSRLRETGLLDKTIVILTSNHGEAFAQHGQIRHDTNVYEEMIRVPLIMRFPGANAPRGQAIDSVVELLDVMPTVADAVAFTIKEQKGRRSYGHEVIGEGRSFFPVLWGGRTKNDGIAYAMSFMGPRAVIEQRWKYIENPESGSQELYDLDADPNETMNVFASNPEEATKLKDRWMAAFNRPALPVQPVVGIPVENPDVTLESLGIVKPGPKRGR